jgi:aspartyl-tRNA(Asn)/glutamyl-tRNA(Gln) amidotransferase subunit A
MMGKLTAHEFAHGGPSFDLPWPPARNPWNPSRFTGGSSSGSAAAVAAGFVLGALGSDTGGSIRGPACLSGIAGLKPSYGLVSRAGVIPNSYSLDHCGPMAWTVEDCALMLQIMAGHDPADPGSSSRQVPDYRTALDGDIRGLRIGVVRHFGEQDSKVDGSLATALEQAIAVLKGLGAEVEDCRMRPLQDYRDVKMVIGEVELFSLHHHNLVERPGEFGVDFLGRTLPACLFQGADYVNAQRERRRMIGEMSPLYERYDALVSVGLGPAPLLQPHDTLQFWRNSNVTTPFNVTGGPALALCCGFSADDLPLGLQIAGRPHDDATVLRVGHAYEQATRWRAKRPVARELEARRHPLQAQDGPAVIQGEPKLDTIAADAVRRAGLTLNDEQMARVRAAAPYVLQIGRRLRGRRDWAHEPASVFMLGH